MSANHNELPKAYNPKGVEDRIYEAWEKSGLFNPDNLPGERTESFCIMMPPPNATGTLHIGHAMFLTLEDMMTRFHRMRGRAALWLPGTDHAAIATNTKVEKLLAAEGRTKYDLGREGFIKRVEEYIEGSRGTIRKQIRKMGSSCDWSREAYTFDEQRNRVVREMFVRLFNDGLIYRGYRIVNWCPRCESTLADDEVEYREEPAKLYYMKYGPFVVATTRPETKLGDTAVAVNPNDERYQAQIGQTFEVNFGIGPQQIRVIADEEVDREFGTGVVGITPAHSAVDFAMAEKNKLPMKKVIGEDGKMTALAGKYAGFVAVEARKKFVADLQKLGLIEKIEDLTHKLSICYRCSTPVEPLTSRQWFVDVNRSIATRDGQTLKQLSLEVVRDGRIKILPERFEKVYYNWMENLRDWCISRQIWFGHRIPVWYCQSCYVGNDAPERVGDSSSYERAGQPGLIASVETPTKCPTCGRDENIGDLSQDTDTLDTWFSSGTWTFSTLGWPDQTADLKKFHPTQCLETGYDILFFWIARMILMTTYAVGEVPFETVYLHGLVRDEQGRKMSKSLENIIDPLDVAEKYGTDAVRLSLIIGNTAGNDLKMSEEKIEYYRNFANKLWNISRFILLNLDSDKAGSEATKGTKFPKSKTLADKWILSRLATVIESVTLDIESYNFSRPGETLREFTWNELADWYLEIAKVEGDKSEMLSYILRTILKLWHPFMPFVTEEIWRLAFAENENDFLLVAEWPEPSKEADVLEDRQIAEEKFNKIREVVIAVRNIRSEKKIEPAKKIDSIFSCHGNFSELMLDQAEIIKHLTRSLDFKISADDELARVVSNSSSTTTTSGVSIAVSLDGAVDFDQQKLKLQKDLSEANKYIGTLQGKLSNDDFITKAPSQVIEAEKKKLAEAEDRSAKLEEQLKALG
ncbi:valine--tRNA ligase [Patescibacteria group bacterium]|nr:valine--tRNA ligase [Patescibacteria group bacterium]